MADVRSMLRAERESRRITHPHASYTSSGNLSCSICEVPVKSDKAWKTHLHSSQHTTKLSERRDAAENLNSSKKRKAVEFEEPEESEIKRLKQASVEEEDEAETTVLIHEPEDSIVEDDAAQLAALQNDLAALEQESRQETITALNAPATISAPATSAKELAEQAREEQSRQRSRRDEELEEEREDAARTLEDEFEEMDSLQERVKKLKKRRDALRKPVEQANASEATISKENSTIDRGIPDRTLVVAADAEDEDDESEDEDEDVWAFGAR